MVYIARMNLNREQFLKAVERGQVLLGELKVDYSELEFYPVFSRFGPRSGQCDLTDNLRKIALEFPEMLAGDVVRAFRDLLFSIRVAEKSGAREMVSGFRNQVDEMEQALLDPELKLYCGDVRIEFRLGAVKFESLRRLQQDSRLPRNLNEIGTVRVVAWSLESLSQGGIE